MSALHAGTRGDQLAIGGNRNTLFGWVTGKSTLGGNELISHQPLNQTVLTGAEPIQLGLCESHAEGGWSRQVCRIKTEAAAKI